MCNRFNLPSSANAATCLRALNSRFESRDKLSLFLPAFRRHHKVTAQRVSCVHYVSACRSCGRSSSPPPLPPATPASPQYNPLRPTSTLPSGALPSRTLHGSGSTQRPHPRLALTHPMTRLPAAQHQPALLYILLQQPSLQHQNGPQAAAPALRSAIWRPAQWLNRMT